MLTIKMAQQLRVDQADLQTELKQFEQAHSVAKVNKDRKGMMDLTKKINSHKERLNRIQEALKDAPVEPWEPERVWEVIISHFNYRETFEKDLAKFLNEAGQNVSYCLEWYTCEIVKSQKKAQLTAWVHQLENIETMVERVETFYKYLPEFTRKMTDEVLRGARKQTSKSTSQSSNLVEAAQLEAVAEMLDGLNTYRVEWAKSHFESWKELNRDMDLDGDLGEE